MLTRDFNSSLKKRFSNSNIREKWIFIFISVILWLVSFGVCIYIQYFFDVVRNKLSELIKRRSKVQEKNISCERALNFYQRKHFLKTISQWLYLWFAYKFTKNYYHFQLFSGFIRTQKRYSTSLGKIHILTWKTTCHIKFNFF